MVALKNPKGQLRAGLPILVFLFIYFSVTFIVTSLLEELLVNRFARNNPFILVIAIVLYVALAGALAIYLYRFRRQSVSAKTGGLRHRIALAFTFVSLATSLPQGYLAFRTALATQDVLLDGNIMEAIDSGLLVVYDIYNEKGELLRRVAEAQDWNAGFNAADLLESMRRAEPEIGYLAVYTDAVLGDAAGNRELFQAGFSTSGFEPGMLPSFGTLELPSVSWKHTIDANRYAVISLELPPRLGQARDMMEASYETLLQMKTFRGTFLIVFFLLFLVFSIPLFLLMAMGSLLLSDKITLPLVNLTRALAEVANGSYNVFLEIEGNDEIASLTRSFNSMVGELETSKRRVLLAEKIEAWKDIAQQLAHEIRNPLTPIRLGAERLVRKFRSDPAQAAEMLEGVMDKILGGVNRLEALLVEFHEFARLPPPVTLPVDLSPLVAKVVENATAGFPNSKVEWEIQPSEELCADSSQLEKVLGILISNALEASEKPARILVLGRKVTEGSKTWYRLVVQDWGRGIPPANRAKIFQPYFTTKSDGTGLGLALVQRIVHDHNGRIGFDCPETGGTLFSIDLPLRMGQ